jgi:ABC-2 type transport system ATP-binding protein
MEVLKLNNVRKRLSEHFAIDGVSFALGDGEFLALLGRNGAGKTTLLRLISGLVWPECGEITILGHSPRRVKDLSEHIGVVHQHSSLPDFLTVEKYLKLESKMKKATPDRVAQAIELAALGPFMNVRIRDLSQGTRRKVAIVKAIMHRPRILFLDEPTVGLDPVVREEIFNTLLALKGERVSAVFATNDLYEAERLCERVLFIEQGRLVGEASIGQLRSQGVSVREAMMSGLTRSSNSRPNTVA